MSLFFVRRSLIAAAAAVLFTPTAHAVPERIAQSSAEALSRLSANAGGKLANSRIADQHYVMVRAAKGATLLADGGSGSPEERARYFLSLHGAVNGVSNPAGQLKTKRVSKGASGSSHVHLDQIQAGIPVFGARSVVHMNASGITGVSGVFVTDAVNLSAQPGISEAAAKGFALAAAKKHNRSAPNLVVESSSLQFFNAGLLKGVAGATRLAYLVVVQGPASAKGLPVREQIFVDASSGVVLERINLIHTALNRITYVGDYGANGVVVHREGNPVGTVPASADPAFTPNNGDLFDSQAQTASSRHTYAAPDVLHLYAGGTWRMYKNLFGADGYDFTRPPAGGQKQESVLLINDACPNAYWNGVAAHYCPGFDLDDVVSHEWSHAYTEYTDGLIYSYQSGALNEAYSDIYGETYDLINGFEGPLGANLSEHTYHKFGGSRWFVGEDLGEQTASFLLRSMWDPDDEISPSPGRVMSENYFCGTGDGGGVHTNSGVPNHAFAMLVDGRPNAIDNSTFNGVPIPRIGMIKAAHIFWAAKTNYQTPTTGFAQHADALDAACQDLKGVNLNNFNGMPSGEIITEADCDAVKAASRAVEYRADVVSFCNYVPVLQPEASTPALCPSGQAPAKFFRENWESGVALPTGWTTGMAFGNTGNTAIANWTTSTDIPTPHTGRAAFFKNDKGGDCAAVDHSARYWLETPAITVPNANSKLEFTHYMQSESLFDGGNIKYALNGSTTWTIVPPAAMTAATGGYNPHSGTFDAATPIGNNTSPNAGQRAWTGSDQGVSTGSWGTTIVNFAQFAAATRPAAGNTIKFRYEFAQDGCNGNLGWFVDDVSAFHCVANAIPTASFTSITPASGEAPLEVSFVVAGTDPDAGDSVVSYTLDFGDGSAPVTQTSANFSHTYTVVGEYTPKLTVTDSRGASSTEVVGSVIEVIEAVAEELDIRFIDRENVKPNTFITSELVTVSGFTGALTVTPDAANGQQVSVNGRAFTSEPVSITANDKIAVRHVSPEGSGTVKITTLRVGSQEVPFKTTNTTLDHVPDAFDFGKKEGVVAGSAVTSDAMVLKGYHTAGVVPGPGLSYSINGGPFTTARSTIECGNADTNLCTASVRVRHTANASSLGYTKTYLAVGGVRGHFVTRTKK